MTKKAKNSKYIRTGETYDYDLFVIPAHQRDRNERNIKRVMESIKEHKIISAVSVRPSIEYPGKYEPYDGQHVITACKRLGVAVVYNVFKDVSNKAMISLNGKSGLKWKLQDYLKWGVVDGIGSYNFLNNVYKEEKIPLTALIMMYGGTYGNKAFKELDWKALQVVRGQHMMRYIKDFEKTYNIKHSRFARFIWGLGKVYDSGKYNHKRMMKQLSRCSQLLTKQANPRDYAKNIQEVYNFGRKDKDRVQFTQI